MKKRIKRLRARFEELKIDALLVSNPAKVRYLTGVIGTDDVPCLVTRESVFLLYHALNKEQFSRQAKGCRLVERPAAPLLYKIRNCNLLKPGWRIGVEGDVSYEDFWLLQQEYPECSFWWAIFPGTNFTDLVDGVAIIKDKLEIQKIKRALRITEKVFKKHILPEIKPGITENELAAEISNWGKIYGAEKDAFDIIVASGERSCIPHAIATSKRLAMGEIVQFDFGHVAAGYPSDFSRVVFLGEPTPKQKEIYNIVLTAQEIAIKAAGPGIACSYLDALARDYIKSHGYDIPHSLGHGLGIKIHSAPSLSQKYHMKLEPGHVVTVEPGIYIPGWGGIRIEDVILINEDGCQNLTTFTKEIIIK